MKLINCFRQHKHLIRIFSAFIAAVLIFELFPYFSDDSAQLTAEAAQTLTQFETARWNEILTKTFENYNSSVILPPSDLKNYAVKNDSPYFNWHEQSDSAWTGGASEVTAQEETITYSPDTAVNGADDSTIAASGVTVKYNTYHVSNADEFVWVMKTKANSGNTRIILEEDIDMGGASGQLWSNTIDLSGDSWFELEGNGHTIYNFRMTKPLINSSISNKKTIIRNVLFSNCLTFFTVYNQGIVLGRIQSPVYLENVSVSDSLVDANQHNIGIFIGRVDDYTGGNIFLKNCSTLRSYVYGTSHIGGLTACQYNTGIYKVKYNAEFPLSPEAWMKYGNAVFPEMIENCYSVDCEVFSTQDDSGALISCGCGFICRNCFTNNTMYGNTKTGAFIGRVVTASNPKAGLHDDLLNLTLHESFINCFASGSVEGTSMIGGFTAYQNSGNNQDSGACVYISCYSTAMVGMEYAGSQLGGFIGNEDTYHREKQHPSVELPDGTISNNYGDVYINCYAAGEVGNILTDTSTSASGNKLGGFLGDVSTNGNGTYYNCYYDKQTTAMRERACGQKDEFSINYSQIPGVEGVYTKTSTVKSVSGLADTPNIMGGNEWEYNTDFYPMLSVFFEHNKFDASFDNERDELVEQYARASAATVLLNHYDTILDETGIEQTATVEDRIIYDTVRDITSKFELTTDDSRGITWGKDTEKNSSRNLADKFGGENGFTLSYTTVNQNENGEYLSGTENESTVNKTFTPDVLNIGRYDDPEDTRGFYYKCFDFAPGIQWLKVNAGKINSSTIGTENDPVYDDGAIIGSRNFRLLPTAYLNAGDIMHINVTTNNNPENVTYLNTVTISQGGNENNINGLFNHSVGTAFAITDKFRMGTDIYLNQTIAEYKGTSLNDNNTFGFYSGYSVNNTNSTNVIDNCAASKNIGSNPMSSQNFNITNNAGVSSNGVSLNGVKNNSSAGSVRVRIFRANPKNIGTSNDFYLERGSEINYSDADTLAKWQGEKPFDTSDSNAYYYLDYYWRLNDGRYLFDRKLVRITADTYSVTMKTGLLNEEFTVNNSTPKTVVDQYVTDKIITNADDTKTWEKDSYPSTMQGFDASTAQNYYESGSYNKLEHINGNDYYTKTLKIDTSNPQTAVGWMRESDYKLTALIVEAVDSTGTHHEMSRIDANNADEPLNFDQAQYAYDYKTYSVIQDSQTKIFSVTENTSVTNTFNVESYSSSMTNSISKYILFSFSTTGDISQGGFSTVNDDLIITALFRKNDASIKTEKQVLANVDDDPIKEVRDTQKTAATAGGDTQTYYSSIDTLDKNKSVDSKDISDDTLRKAVLSGDTLTYRLKFYNEGYFTSKTVDVYDVIPNGTTYVDGSVKLYRQKSLSTSNFDRYDVLEELTLNDNVTFNFDEAEKKIYTTVPSVSLDENYYLEYKVKVDDIKSSEISKIIENQANYKFINFNGDTADDFTDTNSNISQQNAIISMDVEHDNNQYTVSFGGSANNMSQDKTYSFDSYYNQFPDNFEFVINSVQLYDKLNNDITDKVVIDIKYDTSSNPIGFEIKNKDGSAPAIILDYTNEYTVNFKGNVQVLTDSSDEIRNKATVNYTETDSGGTINETKATAVSIVERLTNQTETDVTHLYLLLSKEIPDNDPSQSFVFKIERFDKPNLSDDPDISYTRINCTEKTGDTYSGSRMIQLDKRGYYRITEINDWGSSDYVFYSLNFNDITEISRMHKGYFSSYPDDSFVIQMPRQYQTDSLTFPTSFGGLTPGSYPTLIFTNNLNEYAYKTSQAVAENDIS